MIRRVGIALLFAVFGFLSLLVADAVHTWLCAHIANFCRPPTGPCPGIDTCSQGVWGSALLGVIYLGPAVVFATSAFLFNARRRPLLAWAALLVGLTVLHALIMTLVARAGT
ncbi:hypothetical protein LBW62_23485 [Ralstonia solanacearum]|uniref:hypothetical protein n=1 Tax=Ralstonia solanacearum TaxID=305 RepID=UPI0006991886|nr:hypothetical protein [Ralstonia solanacearum]MDB0544215.1 hypothetical protein [Ralstonia solanacearum]MDB0554004.1 hypothetical protein [Ralstonia solanacearum]MDB0559138.1 hypothetical protein [Ralstonia solanacearum]